MEVRRATHMAGLSINLQTANDAVQYVKWRLPLGAGNVGEDVYFSGGASSRCVAQLRASYPDWIVNGNQTDSWIKSVAAAAEKAKCGNCAEQCTVALEYLLEYSLDSLDFMGFDPRYFDHQFVVIGRSKDSVVNQIFTWGPNAVICNPWQPLFPVPTENRRAYPAHEAMTKMPPFLPAGEHTLVSLGRWDF
jgi:hypothetical protein